MSDILIQAAELDKKMSKMLGSKYYGITTEREVEPTVFIPTGSYSLDKVMGGGIPLGKIVECFGHESTAKSLIMQTIAAQFQKQDKLVALLDVENSIDPIFASYLGLDLNKVALINQLDNLEEVLESTRELVKSGCMSFIGIDSICAVPPKAVQDKKVGEDTMAVAARFLSRHIPEIANEAAKCGCTVFIINQIRSSLKAYGNPEVTTGGAAIKYHASIRIRTSRKETLPGPPGGLVIAVTAVKNKCAPPLKQEDITIYFPHEKNGEVIAGIDSNGDIIVRAIEQDIIVKAGSWFSWGPHKVQGLEGIKNILSKDEIEKIKEELK